MTPQDAQNAIHEDAQNAIHEEVVEAPDDGMPETSWNAEDVPVAVPEDGKIVRRRQRFSAYEVAEQIDVCAELISQGKSPSFIRLMLAERWGLVRRTCERRMQQARFQIQNEYCGMDRKEKVAEIVAAMTTVLDSSIKQNRGSDAIGAVRVMSELLGLQPPK